MALRFVHLTTGWRCAWRVATVGPISISVDASWGGYEKGVYMGCSTNKTVVRAHGTPSALRPLSD